MLRRIGHAATDDEGSVTVTAAFGVAAVIAACAVGAVASKALVDSSKAANAADLAAIAGTYALLDGRDGCLEATQIAQANGAHLTRCVVDGESLEVQATVAGRSRIARAAPL
ncbi:Rv3654c family TadE-like protein [Corynebacterium ulceribovis]|uniref:Rv3654c family TadE-like protein n=1 Tax=Corynebacterium ulceribovis TaxID=487732 RepID=UPI00037316FD|nr:Rv3654c family TadE-like protein [Corynebacterium ulceribovis]